MSAQPHEDDDAPVEAWGSPMGATPKQSEDVWKVELTLTLSMPVETDRRGRPLPNRRVWTEGEVTAEVKRKLGLARDTWPSHLRLVEVDAVYREDDD